MRSETTVEINKVQHYLTIAALILTLASSIFSIGYTMRRIDELDGRLTVIEQKGSIPAQLTSKDVQWIVDNMKVLTDQITRMEGKLDRHMSDGK
jgi:hypothetical protein